MKTACKLFAWMCLCLVGLGLAWPGECQARVYIDITKPFSRRLPLALPEYAPNPDTARHALGADGARILGQDLSYTGLFDILDPKTYLGGAEGQVNPRQWKRIGAELLITGAYTYQGDTLGIEMRLHDVTDGRLMVGRRYDGNLKDLPAMMHRFADEVMEAITGQRSVFSTMLAFVHADAGKKEIWLMNFDGSGTRQFTHRGDITLYPSWSPDGAMLAYTSYVQRRPAAFVQALGGGEGRIVQNRPGVNLTPVFLPSGGQIAVTCSHTGRTNIYLSDLTGNLGPDLTDGWGIEVSPTFSPDGKRMAFVSDRGGTPQIYIRDMTTGSIQRLTFGQKYCAAPDWSPRGDRIAFQAQMNGGFQVATIRPDGSDMQVLTHGNGGGEDPSWSPDGRLIAYASRATGRYQIYVMTAAGQPIRRLTDLPGDNTDPAWSPRGLVGK